MTSADWIKDVPVAHRGYHDMNRDVWENTLSAFTRAIEAGFAIECDVQLSSDSVVVVFHDDDLQRLCGINGDLREKTAAELGLLSVGGTKDRIPTLKRMLETVGGRVPLVIEIKGRSADEDEGFVETVLEVLEEYQGPKDRIALMSFDHHILRDLKRLEAPFPVGLTAMGNTSEEFFTHDEAMQLKLDFISYHHPDLPNTFITAQRQQNIPVITWTVRDEKAREHTYKYADQMTFEGFDPRESPSL
jgi:glycerophosphoryl diester phosphodiesterase